MKSSITVLILTYNEELNLEKCLKSVKSFTNEIFIVDSHSTDKTLEIAKKYAANVHERQFKNQAEQFNWALDNLDIKSDWILKIDADEYLTPELEREIPQAISEAKEEISGFYMKRRVYFMGRWIRYGGYYPVWFLRLWRRGTARAENRKMDEHIVLLNGQSARLQNDFIDDNKKDLKNWILKHKNYALREAEEVVSGSRGGGKKRVIYYLFPPFLRAFAYFIYRYFFRLGFLDGKEGLIFHFLHGFWYRLLVDKKIWELRDHKNFE